MLRDSCVTLSEIVEKLTRSNSLELRIALCAAAFGAVAIGAQAICRLVVGRRLVIKTARFSALEVDELTVLKLRIFERDGPVP
jgi:hypothetical protein